MRIEFLYKCANVTTQSITYKIMNLNINRKASTEKREQLLDISDIAQKP